MKSLHLLHSHLGKMRLIGGIMKIIKRIVTVHGGREIVALHYIIGQITDKNVIIKENNLLYLYF